MTLWKMKEKYIGVKKWGMLVCLQGRKAIEPEFI